jgi:hypothetical protein
MWLTIKGKDEIITRVIKELKETKQNFEFKKITRVY